MEEAKAKGNAAFSAGEFEEAVKHFTEAISHAPENHVLYSNRSAAYCSLKKFTAALDDANKTVQLKPDWPKGYGRQGAALLYLSRVDDAIEAYTRGLALDPSNEALASGLQEAEAAKRTPPPAKGAAALGNLFSGPEVWARIAASSQTRPYLQDPSFVAMLQEVQRDPSCISKYLQDPRMMAVLSLMLNVEMSNGTSEQFRSPEDEPPAKAKPVHKEPEPEPMPEPEVELTPEQLAEKEARDAAEKEKELGNVAYKARNFDVALEHYSKAAQIHPTEMAYLLNRAAVYLEMGKYSECIKDCDDAVELGRRVHADYKQISKAYTRKGNALMKMVTCASDYTPAIEAYQKALTEHRNPDTLKRLQQAERAKAEQEAKDYIDPKLAEEAREKGNEAFRAQQYPEAVTFYSDAMKRDPSDYRLYSNRAACYAKLGAFPESLKDADKCIEMAPNFGKGYSRKGHAQFFMRDYEKALATYQEGLKHDPENEELKEGVRRCYDQLSKVMSGNVSEEELKERQAKAMADPEIQQILTDPVMRQVLNDLSSDPKASQHHLQNPVVASKVAKLVKAGIVRMG